MGSKSVFQRQFNFFTGRFGVFTGRNIDNLAYSHMISGFYGYWTLGTKLRLIALPVVDVGAVEDEYF